MLRLAAAALLLASAPAWAADYTIMAPAAPGGGWDQTARSMQTALVADGISDKVEVLNAPGAGGTVGLIRFAQDSRGNPEDLIVAGYVMVGAILVNHSPIDLGMVTPIARLTGEQEAIVVPATSPIRDIDDLIVMLKADPQWVAWGGGSAGGVDHILAAKVANAVGDPGVRRSDGSPPMSAVQINYVPHSGGGEVAAALRDNKVTVGVSGIGEFESEIEAGHLRVLAVSGEERVPGVDAPRREPARCRQARRPDRLDARGAAGARAGDGSGPARAATPRGARLRGPLRRPGRPAEPGGKGVETRKGGEGSARAALRRRRLVWAVAFFRRDRERRVPALPGLFFRRRMCSLRLVFLCPCFVLC